MNAEGLGPAEQSCRKGKEMVRNKFLPDCEGTHCAFLISVPTPTAHTLSHTHSAQWMLGARGDRILSWSDNVCHLSAMASLDLSVLRSPICKVRMMMMMTLVALSEGCYYEDKIEQFLAHSRYLINTNWVNAERKQGKEEICLGRPASIVRGQSRVDNSSGLFLSTSSCLCWQRVQAGKQRPGQRASVLHWAVKGERNNKKQVNCIPETGCPSCTIPSAKRRS